MSLRLRLVLGMAVVAVVFVAAAWSINRATERNLIRQVDQQLERSDQQVRRGPDIDGDTDPGASGGPPSALFVAIYDQASTQLTTVYSNNLASEPSAPALTGDQIVARAGTGPFTTGATEGSINYRVLVRPDARDGHEVVYALPLADVEETLRRLLTIQAIAAGAILATLGLVTFWVLRLGVRPVQQMTATAKAIGDGDLSQRIPDTVPGTEAGELGLALNHMLGRIEEAFDERTRSEDRLRRFVADASHELRTPVTTIRGYAELYRLGGLSDEHDLDEAMRRTEQEATRMGQLVGDLLDLARLDQGRPLNLRPVDVAQLAADAVADARAVEPDRPLDLDVPARAMVVGDDAHLRQVLSNLVTNARVHTPAGTPIAVRVHDGDDEVVLEVADQGPGMSPEVAAHAFERFYRADPARSRHRGGSGLGLAIVAGSVAAHGGHVDLDTAPGRGATIRVTLPKTPPEGAEGPESAETSRF